MPKGTFYLNPGQFTLKFLAAIPIQNDDFGVPYSERTKSISRDFKHEYASLASEIETQDYFAKRLISNYLYKGPVLEWYLRVKLKLENNYAAFFNLLPRSGTILDLGCGYGFLCYLLHLRSRDQRIIGVDYDEEKIETAFNSYLKSEKTEFHKANIQEFPFETYSGIVLSDVLHYLEPSYQEVLLNRCFTSLLPGGVIIICDGNAELSKRHWRTKLSEFFSIKLLKFNKATNTLNYLAMEKIRALAESHELAVEMESNSKFTSNVMMVVRKKH